MLPPILLDSRRWLVIDKPAGLAVHPGPRTPDSLEALLAGYAPGRAPPAPVHRLDRDTSGCLLLTRDKAALRRLAALFAAGVVAKCYAAIVENPPAAERGRIEAPLARTSSRERGWRMVVTPDGRPAITDWAIIERRGTTALILFRPQTGRTHQLRVHAGLLAEGAAIVGDPVYGRGHADGMMLHAWRLAFRDPWEETLKRAEAPWPARFRKLGFEPPA